MRELHRLIIPVLSISVVSLAAYPSAAQNSVWTGMIGAYTDDANWDPFRPFGNFGETGSINNGGTAFVDGNVAMGPGGLVLGGGAAQSGTLDVRSGGSLTIEQTDMTAGSLVAGQAGTGHLIVARGGTLNVASLSSGGNAASSVVLGEGNAGTASLSVGGAATLNRNTRVIGPNVDFSSDSLTLGGTLTSVITGANHSTLSVGGDASIGGDLDLQFSGYTPGPGDVWDLVDAASISGRFSSITTNVDPGVGRQFVASPAQGGTNGALLQLQIAQILAITVDRNTGSVTMQNLEGGSPVEFDGYSIVSASGALDPSPWNSLENQAVGDFEEANPDVGRLAELNPLGATSVAGGTTFSLGNVYTPPANNEFGVVNEDLVFQYSRPDGTLITGDVEYTGLGINNLVLHVDPDTGEGLFVNESDFTIDIDGYAVLSESGSLRSDNGEWSSLQDQAEGTWEEANVSATQLAELNPIGSATLGNLAFFNLGTLFDTSGTRDLTFEFSFPGEFTPRQGVVVYGELPDLMPMPGIQGDYNGNGTVEQADLDLVLLNWGASFDALPPEWVNERPEEGIVAQAQLDGVLLNWGDTAAATLGSGAVPEPTALIIVLVAAPLCFAIRGARRVLSRAAAYP